MSSQQSICQQPDYQPFYMAIDAMVREVDKHKLPPDFDDKVNERNNWVPDFTLSDSDVLRKLAYLIAYSQQAKASAVEALIMSGNLDVALLQFDLPQVAVLESQVVIQKHWPHKKVKGQPKPIKKPIEIGAIRFPTKIASIINTARAMSRLINRHGKTSFMDYLRAKGIPLRITTEREFDEFWKKFDLVRADFIDVEMPFFGGFTSLCHFFMDFGYDCAKPDSAVMDAAVKLHIVPAPPKQKKHPDKDLPFPETHLEKVVKTIQVYGMCWDVRPTVVDLYFLVHGGQSGVRKLVSSTY